MPPFRKQDNNPSLSDQLNSKLTFFGMVGAVMTGLKLKEQWDDYRRVPTDEEGGLTGDGRVALHSPTDEDDNITLRSNINTEIPRAARSKKTRSRKCCVCCGLNCSLFWKAFGIVLGLVMLWNGIKLIKWALTPSPTGLENMPEFSTSLGCADAPYIFNSSQTTYNVPIGTQQTHKLDILGSAAGTVLITAPTDPDATDVTYQMTIRTTHELLLDPIQVVLPSSARRSSLRLSTGAIPADSSACMRFDMTVYVPKSLKKLDIRSHSTVHIEFDKDASINLDDLIINLESMDLNSILRPHSNVRATNMLLNVERGWLVGDVSIVNSTTVGTSGSSATTNLQVSPTETESGETPETAYLVTLTGTGRTDIVYAADKKFRHRPIDSTHSSLRVGSEMYLTYSDADFNGYVDLQAQSYSARGLQGMPIGVDAKPYAGNKDGGDKLSIKSSRGWVGLYF